MQWGVGRKEGVPTDGIKGVRKKIVSNIFDLEISKKSILVDSELLTLHFYMTQYFVPSCKKAQTTQ